MRNYFAPLSMLLITLVPLLVTPRHARAETDYFAEPLGVSVLPVILVERNSWSKIPDPENPGYTLEGTPVTASITADYNRAVANLTAHMLVAQEKYEHMLKTIQGTKRGTFKISTWNYQTDSSDIFAPATVSEKQSQRIKPFIIDSLHDDTYFQTDTGGRNDNKMMGEIIDAIPTCTSRFNCPYVFVNMYALSVPNGTHRTDVTFGDECFTSPGSAGGSPYNRLKNPGLGYVFYSYAGFINANGSAWNQNSGSWRATHTQSTLLHELGHAFRGAGHTDAAPPSGTSCSTLKTTDYWTWRRTYCTDDVMGVAQSNWVFQCQFGDPSISNPVNSTDANGYCKYPSNETDIVNIHGSLLEEHIKTMAYNNGVFPDLFYRRIDDVDCAMYNLTQEACDAKVVNEKATGTDDRAIEGYPGFVMSASHSTGGGALKEIVGYYENVFAPATSSWESRRMWHPGAVSANEWIHVYVSFPTAVRLGKIRFMTGRGDFGEMFIAKAVKVSNTRNSTGLRVDSPLNDQDVAWTDTRTATDWTVSFQASESYLVVRGIRFFDGDGVEIFAPAEPVAKFRVGDQLTDDAYYSSSLKNIVGANQIILDTSNGYDSTTMWHSNNVGANNHVYIYVTFPEEVALDRVIAYTGYRNSTGGMNHASQETELHFKKDYDTWSIASHSSVDGPNAEFAQNSTRTSNLWRVRMKAGSSGHIVVRGFRFFSGGKEWFQPLDVPRLTTNDGEDYYSRLTNIDRFHMNSPAIPAQSSPYDRDEMWHSSPLVDDIAEVSIEFDKAASLSSIEFYTGYTGAAFRHQATKARIYYYDSNGNRVFVKEQTNSNYQTNGNFAANFTATKAKRWSVKLYATSTHLMVVRGITVNGGNHSF